ncbi:MAG: hypothetical protein F8N37_19325 [Telmatospirillum sp.]|nr:hypothetical protein [Telmatospirillum sp.]
MMIDSFIVDVDFNGIVMFDYPGICKFFDNKIVDGQNILNDFIKTDIGDVIVDAGVVVPIINIDDGSYIIRIFDQDFVDYTGRKLIFSDDGYVLNVSNSIFIADAAVFLDWQEFTGWKKIDISSGFYSVRIDGVQHLNENGKIENVGYDIFLTKMNVMPRRTAKIRVNSRVK